MACGCFFVCDLRRTAPANVNEVSACRRVDFVLFEEVLNRNVLGWFQLYQGAVGEASDFEFNEIQSPVTVPFQK